jgi:hypothetical protein
MMADSIRPEDVKLFGFMVMEDIIINGGKEQPSWAIGTATDHRDNVNKRTVWVRWPWFPVDKWFILPAEHNIYLMDILAHGAPDKARKVAEFLFPPPTNRRGNGQTKNPIP